MKHLVTLVLVIASFSIPGGAFAAGQPAQQPSDDPVTLATLRGAPAPPMAPAVITRDDKRRATVRAIPLGQPLRLDGVLDEAVYQEVQSISDFIQSLPKEGTEPTERTEIWVMFDKTHIYIGGRVWDSAPPERWVANDMRRDSNRLGEQDHLAVMLDTFYDRRNGMVFGTSPLGARFDSAITNEGNPSNEWNPVWDARSGRFEGGWTVEMAIPFKALRYKSDASPVWGIQFRRTLKRKNEFMFLTPVPASAGGRAGMLRISLAATLVGLELPEAATNLEIKPYAISRVETDRLRTPAVNNDADADFGVDAKYAITANLTADLTYNTDFAQVEVDEQQVNLTRFPLNFPEKRDFFLEGRGIFDLFGRPGGSGMVGADTPALFYSRRIGLNAGRVIPISGGGRVTGKAGKFAIGALNIQTADDAVSKTPSTNFTVLRIKRDVLRRSSIGLIATNRSASAVASGSSQTYGVDSAFSFYQDLHMGGYWAQTGTPGRNGDDVSYNGRLEYVGDRYGALVEQLAVGGNFNPEVGFLRRSDFRRSSVSGRFSPRLRSHPILRRLMWEGRVDYLASGAGDLETRHQIGRFDVEMNNSDRFTVEGTRNYELLVRPFVVATGVSIPTGSYNFDDVTVSYTLGQQRRATGMVSMQRGGFYNGTITTLGYTGGRVSLTKHLSFDPSISMNRVELPSRHFTTRLLRSRIDYAFSPWMFTSALLQFNSSDRTFSSNLRFRWEYRPGSEFFAVYTDERDTLGGGFPFLKNRAFVVKINRLLMF